MPAIRRDTGRAVRLAVIAATLLSLAGLSTVSAAGQANLAAVRAATARFHDVQAAQGAGYGAFYICADEPGEGAMGQHFVNLPLVLDPGLDPLQPEALAYAPTEDGGYRLAAVEYLVFAAAWDAEHAAAPSLFGQTFELVGAGNRYGLPPFYELHAWIWQANPSGMFHEWNPNLSCES